MWTCSISSVLKTISVFTNQSDTDGTWWHSHLYQGLYTNVSVCGSIRRPSSLLIEKDETFIWKKQVLDGDYKSDVGPCCLQRLICKVLEDIAALLEAPFLFAVLERLLFHSKIPRSWNWSGTTHPLPLPPLRFSPPPHNSSILLIKAPECWINEFTAYGSPIDHCRASS